MGEGRGVPAGLAGVGLVLACHLPLRWAGRSQGWTCHLNRRACPESTATSAFSTWGRAQRRQGRVLRVQPTPRSATCSEKSRQVLFSNRCYAARDTLCLL